MRATSKGRPLTRRRPDLRPVHRTCVLAPIQPTGISTSPMKSASTLVRCAHRGQGRRRRNVALGAAPAGESGLQRLVGSARWESGRRPKGRAARGTADVTRRQPAVIRICPRDAGRGPGPAGCWTWAG